MEKGKQFLLAGTAGLTLVMGAPAYAADPQMGSTDASAAAAAAPDEAGEIIVTAQKREQRLIDVPVAISAIGSTALTTQSLTRLTDFYDRVPGLQYSGQRVTNISIRGITTGGATSPTVAILVDDVQFGGTTGAGQPPLPDFDASLLDRIEVLRGPQGTLYGASSLGGLIKYVLKQPSTDALSGRVEVSGSSAAHGDEGYAARGTINIPITDWLAVIGSGFKRDDPRYLDNAQTGRDDTNSRKAWGYRGAAIVKPFDGLTITGSALKQHVNAINSDLAITSGGVPICVACTTGGSAATRATAPTTFEPVYGTLTIRSLDSTNLANFEVYSGKASLNIGKLTLVSTSAWTKADNVINSDVTAVFPFLPTIYSSGASVQIANADRTTKFSQELRGTATIGRFDLLAGGFYTVEHAATNQTLILNGGTANLSNLTPYSAQGPSRYRETAGFADLTWHATDKLEIQIGGRYAANKQVATPTSVIDTRAQAVFGPSSRVVQRSDDHVFTWLVAPTYHFSRDIMTYARVATGYRPGGPNSDASGVGPYGPDRVTNYELGFKGRVVPGLLTIDTALFQIDWRKIQLQGTAANNFAFVTNGGKARSRGIEFSANLTPWRGMSLDGNMAISDATLSQDLPALNTSSLRGVSGDRLPATAKFTSSVTALQRFTLASQLQATLSGNFTYVGNRPGGFNTFAGTRPRILIPAYHTVNLAAGLIYDRVWELTASLRNAFDVRGISAAQNRNGVNVPTALFIQPRTVQVTLARNF